MAPWMAEGGLCCLSLKQPMLLDRGLGTQRGESRACSPRVVKSECSGTLPSGCPMAFPEWVWQECAQTEFSRNPVATLGGCWCVPTGSPTSLVLSALGPTHLPIGFFSKRCMGRSAPCLVTVQAFSYFLL